MKKKKISKASKAFYIALSYLSPRLNTKLLFLKKFGRFPDLKDPKTLNEKILKLKLETYGRDPLLDSAQTNTASGNTLITVDWSIA